MSQTLDANTNVTKAYLTLGSNATSSHGQPADALKFALGRLTADSVNLIQTSPFYATPAFPEGSGPEFVNAATAIETTLSPLGLLAYLHKIEALAERERRVRWAPRTLDLDLISYGDAILPSAEIYEDWVNLSLEEQMKAAPDQLILPHPRVQDRAFVLVPLRDVAPDWTHPVTRTHIDVLINALPAQNVADVRPL